MCLFSDSNGFKPLTGYRIPEPKRVLGLGGAGRAAPTLTDGVYMNPSYSSFIPIYSLTMDYTKFNGGRTYNATVQDSRTEMFQAGLGFTRRDQNAAINIGASKQALQNLGFGLGTKILIDDATKNLTFDGSFSTSFLANEWFATSLIIDNLMQSKAGVARNLYRTFYLGTKFKTLDVVQIYIDPVYSPSYAAGKKAGYAAGIELGIMADIFLRFGQFINSDVPYINTHGSGFGMGFGWMGPKLFVDYGYHHVGSTDSGLTSVNAHSLSFTVFF